MNRLPLPAIGCIAVLLALFGPVACGGGDDPVTPPPVVAIAISPTSITLNGGATQQFSATVTNSANTAVTWTSSGGTIIPNGINATWTAPLTGGPFTVTATSVADVTKSASATATVTPIGISITPSTASVGAGGTQQFTALVTNTANTAVTWTSSGGNITGTGATVTWTAPATGGSYTVTATSTADAARTAVANVTVTPVVVSVTPATQVLYRGEPAAITATVTGTTQTDVTWTASCGVVTGTGATVTYTAPESVGPCTVTARSVLDNTKAAVATMTVRPAWRVATYTDADDGACTYSHCTLREAIVASNAQPNTDTIRIVNSAATTITLSSALPVISTSMHVVGPGAALLTINANASTGSLRRAFEFNGAFTASATGLAVRGGIANGGGGIAVFSAADVSLTDVTIVANEARSSEGGGFWSPERPPD